MDSDDLRIRRWGTIGTGYLGPAFHMRFKPGHVLYGSRRTYLRKIAVADFEGITANTTFVIEAKDPKLLLPSLLPFVMQTESFHEHSKKQSKGSVNPYVNFSDLTWYEFAVPPLDEQARIVSVLVAGQAMLEAVRALLWQSSVVHRANLSDIQASTSSKQTRLGDLLAKIVAGRSVPGVDTAPSNSEFGVLKISAVDPDGFLAAESKRLLDPDDFAPEFSVRAGDLLITRANTPELVGEVCLVDRDYPNLMLCDKTLRLEPAEGVDAYLLWEALQSDDVRRQLTSVATGTGRAMKNISQPKIRELVVSYPSSRLAADDARARLRVSRSAMRVLRERLRESRDLTTTLSGQLLRPPKA